MKLFSSILIALLALSSPDLRHNETKRLVLVFKGFMGHAFSNGLNPLADQLKADGHEVKVYFLLGGTKSVKAVRDSRAKKVSMICHSAGCENATQLARVLERKGVEVCVIAAFDPVASKVVSNNVARMISWSQGHFKALAPAHEYHGLIEQHRVRNTDHVAIAGMPTAHARIAEIINQQC